MIAAMFNGLAMLLVLVLALPLGIFAAEVLAGLWPSRAARRHSGELDIAVLMPAHNEAKGIAAAVAAAKASLRPQDRLVVVADNCTDETARIARECGAIVVERQDPVRRGKGFALAHGVAFLGDGAAGRSAPDCVVVLDADCAPQPGAVERLARISCATGRAVQGCYLFRPSALAGPVTRVSNFAFMLKNRVRQRGMARFGGTCVLTGSGMAFPWAQIATADLANGEIVEDLVLGLGLAMAGVPPIYDDCALVFSEGAPSDAETTRQRRRWEHGFVGTALAHAPRLLAAGGRPGRWARIWTAGHLMVPPFMLLLTLAVASTVLLGLGALLGVIDHRVFWTQGALASLVMALVGLAWVIEGRAYLGLGDLLRLPGYLAAKIGIWTGFIKAREQNWSRTER